MCDARLDNDIRLHRVDDLLDPDHVFRQLNAIAICTLSRCHAQHDPARQHLLLQSDWYVLGACRQQLPPRDDDDAFIREVGSKVAQVVIDSAEVALEERRDEIERRLKAAKY